MLKSSLIDLVDRYLSNYVESVQIGAVSIIDESVARTSFTRLVYILYLLFHLLLSLPLLQVIKLKYKGATQLEKGMLPVPTVAKMVRKMK